MENTEYYLKYKNNLILRDVLAINRTALANERTLLSYIRAFFNFVVAGVSFIKLFNSNITSVLGAIFIVTSIPILIIGFRRYIKINKALKLIKNIEVNN